MPEPTLQETVDFMMKAHKGQLDKQGKDFYHHPIAVSDLLPTWSPEFEFKAALLHDVVEDTSFGFLELDIEGFSDETIDIVEMLTKQTLDYDAYIKTITDKGDLGALRVKLADNIHNSDPSRWVSHRLTQRYSQARVKLLDKLFEVNDVDFNYFENLCKTFNISAN